MGLFYLDWWNVSHVLSCADLNMLMQNSAPTDSNSVKYVSFYLVFSRAGYLAVGFQASFYLPESF